MGEKKRGSLKSRPGAMKRKERLERGERERFGRNLAVILGKRGEKGKGKEEGDMLVEGEAGDGGDGDGENKKVVETTKGRFAALRAWVGENIERHPAFEKRE